MMAQVNAGRVRFVGRGEYNNSTQYYVFDLVSYNGNSYYAKVDTIGHLPTDTTYWQLVAEKGNVGPTGLTGNGISSIEKTSTSGLVDTYTITYTNGNTTTFDVSNGNGIDRIEKTATVGNKDTYTIYFTNGSTTTYEVSNGEVTREELEEEVERLSMIYNAFPSTTGETEEGSINGTAEVPFKEIGLKGNTSQESTTGKNLFNKEAMVSSIRHGSYTYNNGVYTITPDGTSNISLAISCVIIPGSYIFNSNSFLSNATILRDASNTVVYNFGTSYSNISFTTTIASAVLEFNWANPNNTTPFTLDLNSLMISTSGGDYEPYTGGNPAPNPDYPYPVNVVSGNNSIKVFSKNIVTSYRKSTDMLIIDINKSLITSKTITLSMISSEALNNNSLYIHYDSTQEFLTTMTASANTRQQKTITFTDAQMNKIKNANYVYFHIYKSSSAFTNVQEVQIEMGGNVTSYQNYQTPQTYPINLGSMELCKIGDYQDVIKRSSGKNLFDKDNVNVLNAFINNAHITTSSVSKVLYIQCKSNATYTISKRQSERFVVGTTEIRPIVGDNIVIQNISDYSATSITITTNSTANYIVVWYYNSSVDTLTEQQILNSIMINEGSTALPYEPYGKVWYKYGAIGKVVLDGSENWNASGNNTNTQRYATNATTYGVMSKSNGYCNNNRYVNSGVSLDTQLCGISLGIYYYRINQGILSEYSATKFKEWVANNNITNYIPLITPTITPITDTTLIEQLDNLEKAYSYDTQTNISQTNQDKPFIISYEAILSLKNVLNS